MNIAHQFRIHFDFIRLKRVSNDRPE
jgi:hypothetical protein